MGKFCSISWERTHNPLISEQRTKEKDKHEQLPDPIQVAAEAASRKQQEGLQRPQMS
jgi:hypothetical protein